MLRDEVFNQGIDMIEVIIGKKYTNDQKKYYKTLLNELKEDKFIEAINKMLRTRKYSNLPTPAEIYQLAIPQPEELFLKVRDCILEVAKDYSMNYVFEEPITHKVLENFDLKNLSSMNPNNLEILLNTTVKPLIESIMYKKLDAFPLIIGYKIPMNEFETDYPLKLIGDKKKIEKWVGAYKNKIIKINADLLENTNKDNSIIEYVSNEKNLLLKKLNEIERIERKLNDILKR